MNLQGIFCSRMISILCSSQNTFIEDGYDDFSLFSERRIFIFIIFLVVPIVGTCPIALMVIQHLWCQETILDECCPLGLHQFIHLAVEQQKGIERHSFHNIFPFSTLFLDKSLVCLHFCRDLIYLARESRELPPSPLEKEYARLTAHPENPVSVSALAASAGYSTARFIELFRARWGVTPKDYLLSLRISRAQMLLHTTDLSVSEIAHRVGYEDPLYFSRLFRRRTGNSPAQERALAKL